MGLTRICTKRLRRLRVLHRLQMITFLEGAKQLGPNTPMER
jgi:hypothetical protein